MSTAEVIGPEPVPAGPAPATPDPSASAAWTGQTGRPTRLVLLRHGQTELSVQRRYSGHGDPELTPLGHAQAAALAARLAGVPDAAGVSHGPGMPDVAAVLTSPLRRARQTAAAVADATGAPLVTRDGLIETDFGAWDGLTFAEARERDPELHAAWLGSEDVAPPGGESFADVGRRVAAERAAAVEAHPGETVLLVSHVTPIKMLLRHALQGGPSILFRLHLDLASVSIVDLYPDGGASVRLVNDTGHLGAVTA